MILFHVTVTVLLVMTSVKDSSSSNQSTTTERGKPGMEPRGPIKEKQAEEQCEILMEMSGRRDVSQFVPMRRPPPADEAVIGCYIKDGFPCFPKDVQEEHQLLNYYNDAIENREPAHARNYYCLRHDIQNIEYPNRFPVRCSTTQFKFNPFSSFLF